MREPLITLTCDCGASVEVAYGERLDVRRRAGRRGTRIRSRHPSTERSSQPSAATACSCSGRRSCMAAILIPLAVLIGLQFAFLLFVLVMGYGLLAVPQLRRRVGSADAEVDEELEAAAGVARARNPAHPNVRGHPRRLGQPPGDARHVRRPLRARGDRARGRRRGRVGPAPDRRQPRRGSARARSRSR